VESRLLERMKVVAGVEAAVVEVGDFEDGELVEHTFDYYAQREDGTVLYMGEHVNDIENGDVVGHEGQWLAGRKGANPGIFMPADPEVGDTFQQGARAGRGGGPLQGGEGRSAREDARGVLLRVHQGEDFAPLDKLPEFKYYCPDVDLVREDITGGEVVLARYR